MNRLSKILLVIIILLLILLGIVGHEFYKQAKSTAESGVYMYSILTAIEESDYELQLTDEAKEYFSQHRDIAPNGPYKLVPKGTTTEE